MDTTLRQELDNSLSKLDAMLRLLGYLHEVASREDRFAQREGEEMLVETMLVENHRARLAHRTLQRLAASAAHRADPQD